MRTLRQTVVVASLAAGMVWAQNVGIGTTTPLTRLHVASGDIFLGDATGADGFVLHSRSGAGYDFLQITSRTAGSYEWGKGITFVRSTGNVGIGTTAPAERLHVEGNIRFSGALMPAGNAGTAGQVLVSQGAGNAPQWQDPSALTGFYKLLFVDAWNPSVNSNLGWSCTNCSGGAPYLTTCGTVRMLGGYGMCGSGCYFEKTFTGLPPHTEVMVEVFWWSVDSWDQHNIGSGGVDLVALSIDGTEVSRATPYGPYDSNGYVRATNASVCGANGWIDIGPQILAGWAAHTASSVTVRVTNLATQGSTDESMGIVMVRVWVK